MRYEQSQAYGVRHTATTLDKQHPGFLYWIWPMLRVTTMTALGCLAWGEFALSGWLSQPKLTSGIIFILMHGHLYEVIWIVLLGFVVFAHAGEATWTGRGQASRLVPCMLRVVDM